MTKRRKVEEPIERWAVWDRPQPLAAVAERFARDLYEAAGYEVLHKTKLGASIMPERMGHPMHHFIRITFEEVEP